MGYEREAIITSVTNRAYDEIYATYMLLGTKEPDVSELFELFETRENFEDLTPLAKMATRASQSIVYSCSRLSRTFSKNLKNR